MARMTKTLWLALFLAGAGLQAATLQESVQAALKQSEALATDQESLRIAEERYKQAWGSLAPTVNLTGSYLFQDDDSPAGNPGQQKNAKLTLGQPILRGFREYAAIKAAKAEIRFQEEAQRFAQSRAALDVVQAYYSVLSLEADQATLQEQVDLYEKRVQDLKKWVGIGRSRPNEVLNAQAVQASLKAQQAQVKGQILVARELLAFLTGLEPSVTLEAVGAGLPALDEAGVYLKGSEQRPELLAAARAVDLARAQVGIARGGRGPSVDLNADYFVLREGASKDVAWDATLVATLPLFAGFTVSSQVKQAEGILRQAELAQARAQRLAKQDVSSLLQTLGSELEQAQALQEALLLAEKNYEADAKDYNLGLVTNVQVLQSLANAKDTQRSLNHARYSAFIDARRLSAAAGLDADLLGAR
jgi:outer membrane protein